MSFGLFLGFFVTLVGVSGLIHGMVRSFFGDSHEYRVGKDVVSVEWSSTLVHGSVLQETGNNVLVKLWFGREPEVWFLAQEIKSRRPFLPVLPVEQDEWM